MESFHIFKPCGDHLVAHLYEHLVMQTMHRQLFEAGLFQAIDYQAYGIVYSDAGVMGIDVTLYTMQAERFVAQLRQPVAQQIGMRREREDHRKHQPGLAPACP